MTRYIIAVAAVAGLTAVHALPVTAQTPPPASARTAEVPVLPLARMIEIHEALDLSPQQIERIRAISARLEEQNRPLRAQLKEAREKVIAERRDMTPADRERLQRERTTRMDSVRARIRESAPAHRDSMRARLEGMTPAERDSMRARMQRGTPARPGMRPPMMRGGMRGPAPALRTAIPEELRPVMEQLRANAETAAQQIRDVLTDAQRQKLKELRADRRPGAHGPAGPGARNETPRQTPRGGR